MTIRNLRVSFLWLSLAVALTCLPAAARADEPLPPLSAAELEDEMRRYLYAEKRGGAVLMGMGVPAVALGGGLLAQDEPLWRGFAYPVLIIGALEVAAGLLFYARTNRQVAQLGRGFRSDPLKTRDVELVRMRRIDRQFALLEGVEIALLAGGIAMAAAGGGTRDDTLLGVGLGLALQSGALLTFDMFASRRALRYTESLQRLHLGAGPAPAPPGLALPRGATVSVSGLF